ncbi:MAG: carboxylating nicotinate-nucleotide diphosphorylase [Dehalococcoidia bacterium]|nr:carboxylating nicotinate-nucleotide diphosphorylase [Dehalococcoidia bacterium]
MKPLTLEIDRIIERAIEEDLTWGDLTTQSILPPNVTGSAVARAKQRGVIAGIEIAAAVFTRVDGTLFVEVLNTDGVWVEPGTDLLRIEGRAPAILAAERVALNFLQHLSGIATMTALFVQEIAGAKAKIIDTRKTTPGLRVMEKYAVRVAGGFNHRFNLSDGILIKDNHIATLEALGGGVTQAIQGAKTNAPHGTRVQVEVATVEEAVEAANAGADALLFDNMSTQEMADAVHAVGDGIIIEASGGVTLDRVKAVAETGVDLISVGALTHSSLALDISLGFEPA